MANGTLLLLVLVFNTFFLRVAVLTPVYFLLFSFLIELEFEFLFFIEEFLYEFD